MSSGGNMSVDKTELLPCPFCGTAPVVEVEQEPTEEYKGRCTVGCENIHCPVSPYVERHTQQELLKSWNTRTTPPVSADVRKFIDRIATVSGIDWSPWVKAAEVAAVDFRNAVVREALERAAKVFEKPNMSPPINWVAQRIRQLIGAKDAR